MNPDKDRIAVQYLFESEPERAWPVPEICTTLGFHGKQLKRLQAILRQLVLDGAIVELRQGVYGLGAPADLVTGQLTIVRSGNGYVNSKVSNQTVWVSGEDLGTALTGDTVTARLHTGPTPPGAARELRGKVIRIVARSPRDIVGTLFTTGRFLYVVPLNPVYRQDFVVPEDKGAKAGDRVVVRFTAWLNRHVAPEGVIVDVIGPADQPSLDTEVICRQYDLPGDYPADALREAESVAGRLTKPGRREDLRDTFILTIDPARARDFDDAISVTHDDRGQRVLGVHIADVSHFVRPGSALDEEARERGTSIYLVDRVIPMLPEQLSNGVCSLRPDEDRLCFSAFLTFDAAGKMVARRFAKSLIRSRLRLTYEQALALAEGRPPQGLASAPPEAAPLVREVAELALQLRNHRLQQGALDLELPECEVQIGPDGRMTGINIVPHDISHQLIEECMVAANEAVATELASRGIRILSRLHEPPDPEKIEELTASLRVLGFTPGDLRDPRRLSRFLADTVEHPLRYHAHTLVLRSMKRALYSPEQTGHFGLAKRFYAHFTSPIRRYPDLVLHRQLAAYLTGEEGRGTLPAEQLKAAAERSTDREQRADEASRALIEIKKFRFLQQQLDDRKPLVYDAAVSRVANFGLFVDIRDLQMTGLVHVSAISDQFVRYNRDAETLSVGNQVFRIGYKLQVHVARVDFNQRRADFAIVRDMAATPPPAGSKARRSGGHKPAPAGQRGSAATSRPAGRPSRQGHGPDRRPTGKRGSAGAGGGRRSGR